MNRKNLMLFFLASVLVVGNLSVPVAAYGPDSNYMRIDCGYSGPTELDEKMLAAVNEENDIAPVLLAKSVSKTVKKMYTDRNSIPAALGYEEYIDGRWYGGILTSTNVRYVNATGLYEVTFSGTMYGQNM